MRRFILITSRKLVYDEPGIHARCLVAALLISRSIRKDSVFYMYLREGFTIEFHGSKIRQLRADEASAFGIINKAIKEIEKRSPHTGVYIKRENFSKLLSRTSSNLKLFSSTLPGSKKLSEVKLVSDITYVTTIDDYNTQEIEELTNKEFLAITFPKKYTPEHEFVVINNLIDIS